MIYIYGYICRTEITIALDRDDCHSPAQNNGNHYRPRNRKLKRSEKPFISETFCPVFLRTHFLFVLDWWGTSSLTESSIWSPYYVWKLNYRFWNAYIPTEPALNFISCTYSEFGAPPLHGRLHKENFEFIIVLWRRSSSMKCINNNK